MQNAGDDPFYRRIDPSWGGGVEYVAWESLADLSRIQSHATYTFSFPSSFSN